MTVEIKTAGANWILLHGSGFYAEVEVAKAVWDALNQLEFEAGEKE